MALDLGIFLEGSQSTFKVKVSKNDAQAQFLLDKFISSDGSVTITETNDGGIEQINLTTSGGGGISSPLTTKGDLFTYSTVDARLGVGTDGQALIADSAEATGLKWGTVSGDNMATADLTLTGDRTHDLNGNVLKFDNGQITIEGSGSTSATTSILIQNSSATQLFKIDDAGGFALGSGASHSTTNAVTIGNNALTSEHFAISIGASTDATAASAIAIGYLAQATNLQAIAIGRGANTTQSNSISLGYNTDATNTGTIAFGNQAQATGYEGITMGTIATASGSRSTSLGSRSLADSSRSMALGNQANATANYSIMLNARNGVATNSTANSFAVNCNSTDHLFFIGNTADGWLNTTGSFGFGTITPSASAVVDLNSTTKGFLPPRMTTTEKNAITTPATGLVVFDNTLAKLCIYTGSAWETVTSA